MKRPIQPVSLGLNMGIAHFIQVRVDHILGSEVATLYVDVFDENQHKMLPSPLQVAVPTTKLQEWDYDFSAVTHFAAAGIAATFDDTV